MRFHFFFKTFLFIITSLSRGSFFLYKNEHQKPKVLAFSYCNVCFFYSYFIIKKKGDSQGMPKGANRLFTRFSTKNYPSFAFTPFANIINFHLMKSIFPLKWNVIKIIKYHNDLLRESINIIRNKIRKHSGTK